MSYNPRVINYQTNINISKTTTQNNQSNIYDKNSNLLQRFDYADSRMPISMTMGADKYYLHYDQVGSLRVVSDSNGNIVKEVVYDTFGNILSDSNPSFRVPFGFAGGLYDSDTKLTRFGYRDYDAYTGKWTAKDPIGFDGGDSNLYGYVLGDPVGFVDSDGLMGKGGNQNYKGDDLAPYSDEELDEMYKDKSTPNQKKQRIKQEQKARKNRNKEKRKKIVCDADPIYTPNPWKFKRPFSIWDLFLTPAY